MIKTLNIDLEHFPFYNREIINNKRVKNKCGRDFLYYCLMFYKKEEANNINPLVLNNKFGINVPSWLAWTQLQFIFMPKYLKEKGLILDINKNKIHNFIDFIKSTLFSRISLSKAIQDIENSIDKGIACGIDISIGIGGLLDHVMFVYGYDKDNLYIFETTDTPIKYEEINKQYPSIKKISKDEINKRWTKFGRVWRVFSV